MRKATHRVVTAVSGRRRSTWGRRGWRLLARRSARSRLLLLRGLLLVVLVVGDIVLIPAVCGIWILTAIILSVLGIVVCCWASGSRSARSPWRSLNSCSARGWELLATITAVSTLTAVALTITLLVAASISSLLRRVCFELFVLLSYVSQQIFTKLFRMLNLVGIGAADKA